jgi:hypothetical protein
MQDEGAAYGPPPAVAVLTTNGSVVLDEETTCDTGLHQPHSMRGGVGVSGATHLTLPGPSLAAAANGALADIDPYSVASPIEGVQEVARWRPLTHEYRC